MVVDLSLVPKPEHEEWCCSSTCPDGSKRTPAFILHLTCQVEKFIIAFILQVSLGDCNLLMNVNFLAFSLEIGIVEGQAIFTRAIKEVFMSVSGLLVIKMGR